MNPHTCSTVALALYAIPTLETACTSRHRPPCSLWMHTLWAWLYCVVMFGIEAKGMGWMAWLLTAPPVLVGHVIGPLVPVLAELIRAHH